MEKDLAVASQQSATEVDEIIFGEVSVEEMSQHGLEHLHMVAETDGLLVGTVRVPHHERQLGWQAVALRPDLLKYALNAVLH